MKLSKATKIILAIFLISTGLFLSNNAYADDNLKYRVIRIDNSPQGKARRFTYHVLVNPGTTKKDMEQISLKILEQAKKENPFNALAVGFYDYPKLTGYGFRFGKVEFAPNARWSDASTVSIGDYSRLQANNNLIEPDWDNALTKREADIFVRHNRLLNSLLKKANTRAEIEKAENQAIQSIIKKYKITQEELDNIYSRYNK